MQFRVEAAIPRSAGDVWAVLVDIPKIASCIPGCDDVRERTRLADYSAVLNQKLGPFKVALPANIEVHEVREPSWIMAVASGTEKFTRTRIDVTLKMDLRDTQPGQSHMVAECDLQVAGKLATLGYAVIKKKAEENFAEFRSRLLKVLEDCPVLAVEVAEVVEGSTPVLPAQDIAQAPQDAPPVSVTPTAALPIENSVVVEDPTAVLPAQDIVQVPQETGPASATVTADDGDAPCEPAFVAAAVLPRD